MRDKRIRIAPWVLIAGANATIALAESNHFNVNASANMQHDPAPLHSERFIMRGTIEPANAALSQSPLLLESNRFVLAAKMVAVASVCYNDTIFRDDYDGDGG